MRNKDFDYFQCFVECSKLALDAAVYLDEMLKEFDPKKLEENVKHMHRIENDADEKKHEMLKFLSHEFMTAIEREDIVALSQQLDNVVDSIEEVAQRLYMFDIQSIRADTGGLTSMIVECCKALLTVTEEFAHFRKSRTIKEKIIKVNSIESEGDVMHAQSMRKLFTDGTELREITVWMVVYECLEGCLDACEDAADIIESVIMKNT